MSPILLLLTACNAPKVAVTAPIVASSCIVHWTRSADTSVFADQPTFGASAWTEAPRTIPASPLGVGFVPAPHTAQWMMGMPIFWFDPTGAQLVVDAESFETLTPVDTTTLRRGGHAIVGQVLPKARVALGDRTVVELLVEADVLRVYREGSGQVCLVEEGTAGGTWAGRFVGSDEEPGGTTALGFRVRIDGGGRITVFDT